MGKKFVIEGIAEACPLCLENPEGRSKERRPPVFLVGCDGGYTGAVCAPHLAALIKAVEGKSETKPLVKAEARPEPKTETRSAAPPQNVSAAPSPNGIPPAIPVGAK